MVNEFGWACFLSSKYFESCWSKCYNVSEVFSLLAFSMKISILFRIRWFILYKTYIIWCYISVSVTWLWSTLSLAKIIPCIHTVGPVTIKKNILDLVCCNNKVFLKLMKPLWNRLFQPNIWLIICLRLLWEVSIFHIEQFLVKI